MFKNQLLNRAKLHSPVQKKKKKAESLNISMLTKDKRYIWDQDFKMLIENKTKQNKMLIGFVCVFVKKIKIDDRCV